MITMSSTRTNVIRTCEKCAERVRLYIVCFKCDFIYHPNCWRRLPEAYLNENGHAFCCWNLTSNQEVSEEDVKPQELLGGSIEEEDEYEHSDVSGNCQLREDDLQKKQKISKEHICTHTNYKPFKCTYKDCKCTPEQKDACKCSTCGYATAEKGHLNKHLLVKHSGKSKKYNCVDCNYATHRRDYLTLHIRTHTNDRPFKCTYKNCECAPEQKEACKCNICGYATAVKGHLNKHILVKHSGKPKKHKCADCEYATHTKSHLKVHILTHINNRSFKCMYKNCKCTPEQKETCKCNACGYTAATRSELNEHKLVKHSGKPKKYKCGDCNYATHKRQRLTRHIRTHTND